MFVLFRVEKGHVEFATPPGSLHSYTRDLTEARTFRTRSAAVREACGNETAADIETLLRRPED